jgi:adenylate cyclase
MGSANGTYLNGRRLAQPARLADGDRVAVADFQFTFHNTQAPVAASASTALSEATIHEIRNLTCWLLLADIENSTRWMRKVSGAEGPRLTGPWFTACRQVLVQYHGAINKYLGDGFLAYWPAGPHAPAWVAGALGALKSLQEQAEPQFRVVVHYGNVSAGGAASMGEESLAGNEVNFIFRAEKLAGALGHARLLSTPAREQLGSLLPSQPAGKHQLPGFEGEFAFFSY